jgi:hypothetical protein
MCCPSSPSPKIIEAMLTVRHRSYLGAVALNNSAVTLLERGRYRQAIKVMQNSIFMMKTVPLAPPAREVLQNENIEQREAETMSTLTAMLQNATRAIAESEKPSSTQQLRQEQEHKMSATIVESLELGVDSPPGQLKVPEKPWSSANVLPLRIEAPSIMEALSHDPDFESIIILYNFAVAQYLYSHQVDQPRSGMLLKNALTVANLASFIWSKCFNRCNNDDDNDPVDNDAPLPNSSSTVINDTETLLELSLLILNFLHQIYIRLGLLPEAAQVSEQYNQVLCEMDHTICPLYAVARAA